MDPDAYLCQLANVFNGISVHSPTTVSYTHLDVYKRQAMNYGFKAMLDTPGNVAGLGRFDELLGCTIFHSIYGRNSNVFEMCIRDSRRCCLRAGR